MLFLLNYYNSNVHSIHFAYIIILFTDFYVREKNVSKLSSYW